ncbi:MAG: hypothetical protein AAF560_01445 [Acidobacteriota bacterium]
MSETPKPPTWFWIVSGVSLVWNLLGLLAFISQMTMSPEALAALPEAERTFYETVPAWATVAFAIAVFGGTLGCVALLLRKAWAEILFVLSLLGVLTQNINSFLLSDALSIYGPTVAVMQAMVIAICVFLIWLARSSKARGWIA